MSNQPIDQAADNSEQNDVNQQLLAEQVLEASLKRQIKETRIEIEQLKEIHRQKMIQKNASQKQYQVIANRKSLKLLRPAQKATAIVHKIKERPIRKAEEHFRYIKRTDPLDLLNNAKMVHKSKLIWAYRRTGLNKQKDTFILYRIIGNDLYPRHKQGQSQENLRFILENEPEFKDCEKRFVVNRIVDKVQEKGIIKLLKKYRKQYIHIPFESEEYQKVGLDIDCLPFPGFLASKKFNSLDKVMKNNVLAAVYRLKNNYIMNNNGARNRALREGKKRAKWVLPWDGNCFITQTAWEKFTHDVVAAPHFKYFIVPMSRVLDNKSLLLNEPVPKPIEEPQIIFRADSMEEFNEQYYYGRRPKIELFWRLKVPGKWDTWVDELWDLPRGELSSESRQFGIAGWVARMFSGVKSLELDSKQSRIERGSARNEAIISTIQNIDSSVNHYSKASLFSYSTSKLVKEVEWYRKKSDPLLVSCINSLLRSADEALLRQPPSVVDKTTLPPSGNKNDYWHPAPYWWSDPTKPDGLPYIRKDGERVPGTAMYEPDSNKYDRTRLQYMFDDSIVSALAWKFSGNKAYAKHATAILERFFINPETRMNPHLRYSQVRLGHNNNHGSANGIIEMKDLYYYLDAVRLLDEAGVLSSEVIRQFDDWLAEYLEWVLNSPQGVKECSETNNHGPYYDIQVAAIANYLGKQTVLFDALLRVQSRIPQQFAPDGSQPEELKRTMTAHYCSFNLQGWIILAHFAKKLNIDLWGYQSPEGASLQNAVRWLLNYAGRKWPYPQIESFDADRIAPIRFEVPTDFVSKRVAAYYPKSKYSVKPLFHPHDAIKPYWNLGLDLEKHF